MEKTLSVSAIRQGTVIDHIPTGCGLKIIHLLHLASQGQRITIGLNLPSQRLGAKDLIKLENRFLNEREMEDIAVFAPATICIIRDFAVERKIIASLPPTVKGLLTCPNPRCITHGEMIPSFFSVEDFRGKVNLRCKYCEKTFIRDDVYTE